MRRDGSPVEEARVAEGSTGEPSGVDEGPTNRGRR